MQELREQEKRQEEERERLLEQKQVSRHFFPPCLLYENTRNVVYIKYVNASTKEILSNSDIKRPVECSPGLADAISIEYVRFTDKKSFKMSETFRQ